MAWYIWVALACMIIAPFDALYMHIRANRRREELRRREGESESEDDPAK